MRDRNSREEGVIHQEDVVFDSYNEGSIKADSSQEHTKRHSFNEKCVPWFCLLEQSRGIQIDGQNWGII